MINTFSFLQFCFHSTAVGSTPKSVREKPSWGIQKNLKNINWYSWYESSKAGKCHTFIIPLWWPEWFRSCFGMRWKIFSKITQQTTRIEVRPNTAPFSSTAGLRKFILGKGFFVPRLCFICHLTAKSRAIFLWLPLQVIFSIWYFKQQTKAQIRNYIVLAF